MYATVRRHEGVINPPEVANRVRDGFVPLISAMPGLVEYDCVDLGQGVMLSVSVFDSFPRATEANQTALRWMRTNLAALLTQNPRIEAGEVVAHNRIESSARTQRRTTPTPAIAPYAATPARIASGAVVERLNAFAAERVQHFEQHVTVRCYEGVTNPEEAAKQVRDGFVPVISALPGFIAYYWIDLGHGAMLSVSIFDSLSNAIESGQAAAGWVRANLSSVLPQSPRIEAGKVVAKV